MLRGHYPASSLLRSPPTPGRPTVRVIDSPNASGVRPPACRVSRGSSAILSRRAVRSHPGGPPRCPRWSLPGTCWLQPLRQPGHPPLVFRGRNRFISYGSPLRRPVLSHLRRGFFSPTGLAPRASLPPHDRPQLHAYQQFTWQPPFRSLERPGLSWRTEGHEEETISSSLSSWSSCTSWLILFRCTPRMENMTHP